MIKAIRLINFQGYSGVTTIPLGTKTILKGENDSGKSTIRQAIEVFSPTHSNIDNRSLINNNCHQAEVILYLDNYQLKAELKTNKTNYSLLDKDKIIKAYNGYDPEIAVYLGLATTSELLINCLHSHKILIDTSPKVNAELIKDITTLPEIEEKLCNINDCYNRVNGRIYSLNDEIIIKEDLLNGLGEEKPIEYIENLIKTLEYKVYIRDTYTQLLELTRLSKEIKRVSNLIYYLTLMLNTSYVLEFLSIQKQIQKETMVQNRYTTVYALLLETKITILKRNIVYMENIKRRLLLIQSIIHLKDYINIRKDTDILLEKLYTLYTIKLHLYTSIKSRIKEYCPNCGYVLKGDTQ